MTRYRNGEIPRTALVVIASGTNGDGYWEHQLTPSQKYKHDALVALGKKRHGRTLKITSGWNGFRPIAAQKVAKAKYGKGAAAVGFSSHGGTYKGRDAMAMDYGNWSWVYNGDREAFFADCRAVGLTPGVIANESWHVIDYDPWAAVPAGAQKENDLGTIDNTEENYQTFAKFLQRALKWDVRKDGFGADAKHGATVWDRLGSIEASAKSGPVDVDRLAAELRSNLAPEIVKALGKKLSG